MEGMGRRRLATIRFPSHLPAGIAGACQGFCQSARQQFLLSILPFDPRGDEGEEFFPLCIGFEGVKRDDQRLQLVDPQKGMLAEPGKARESAPLQVAFKVVLR